MKLPPLLLAAVVLAGCGSHTQVQQRPAGPPLPPLGKRCGTAPVRSRTLWFYAADGTRLDGAELGTGPRGVILLHEVPADLCGWAPYAETLARRHYHVLLVDLRSYGLSGRGAFGAGPGAIADVRGSVRELRKLGATKIVVVGASYGGVAAVVGGAALGSRISAVASLSGELSMGYKFNALAAVRHLRVPLLVMGSRQDRYLNAHDARMLVNASGSEESSLVEFPGFYHGWDLLYDSPRRRHADDVLAKFLASATE